jgi:hypothetical protein
MRKEIEKKLFNIELQDKFGKYDLIRLWLYDFMYLRISIGSFQSILSNEWAAFPENSSWKSAHHWVGKNKAQTTHSEAIENLTPLMKFLPFI